MTFAKHFTLEEFTRSDTADRLGIRNDPDAAQLSALEHLARTVMDPVREAIGVPVTILSGLRVSALNQAVPGSSSTSQHCLGEACDFRAAGVPVCDVTRWLMNAPLPWDQLILEFADEARPSAGWTHVSAGPKNRRQVLTATSVGGKTRYTVGLPAWVLARPALVLPGKRSVP